MKLTEFLSICEFSFLNVKISEEAGPTAASAVAVAEAPPASEAALSSSQPGPG